VVNFHLIVTILLEYYKNNLKKKQKSTSNPNGNYYMERVCAPDCSASTNPLYGNNLNGQSQTVINACCTDDGCNDASTLFFNKILLMVFVFMSLIFFY
jgi:hypothetical protein